MNHFHMDFYDALDLIEEKVPICNIDPLHITVLKKDIQSDFALINWLFDSNKAILKTLVFSFAAVVKEGGGSGDIYLIL